MSDDAYETLLTFRVTDHYNFARIKEKMLFKTFKCSVSHSITHSDTAHFISVLSDVPLRRSDVGARVRGLVRGMPLQIQRVHNVPHRWMDVQSLRQRRLRASPYTDARARDGVDVSEWRTEEMPNA